MPFGVVSRVDQGMSVLDGSTRLSVCDVPKRTGRFRRFFCSIGLNSVFECIFKTKMCSTRACMKSL